MKPTRDEQAFAEMLEGLRQDAPRDLARLAKLAAAMEHVRPAPGPSPDFRAALRNRIVAEAAVSRSWLDRFVEAWEARNIAMRRNFKMVFATAVAAIVLLAGGSVFAVAAKSVPGDWDYFAKRLHEDARLLVTRANVPRAYLEMDFARERLDEMKVLIDRGKQNASPYFTDLNDMDARTLDAARLLVTAFRQTHQSAPLNKLASFAAAQRNGLEVLIDHMPPAVRPPARDSIDILQRVSDRVVGIMGGCPCPANALLPQVTSESGPPGSNAAPTQAPVCDCTRIRGDGGSDNNAQGPVDNGDDGHGNPKPPPTTPPTEGPIDSTIDQVTGTVNDTTKTLTDTVNQVIDDALHNTPLAPVVGPTPVPTVSINVPNLGH